MKIVEIREYSEKVHAALNGLLPQLSESALPLTAKELKEIIQSDSSHLLMAEEDGSFYGSLTLVVYKIPTGKRAWIEDVVVNQSARGRGIGRLLSEAAIRSARELGAQTVNLTSRSSRKAANILYQQIGFKPRETNVYRYDISNESL